MLRRILNIFRPSASKNRRLVPSSPSLPELWPAGGTRPRIGLLDDASTETLTELCDDYWNSFLVNANDQGQSIVRDLGVHRRAMKIICSRGGEGLLWARERLRHVGYDAREDAASLIAQLAETDQLGTEKEAIARELVTLAVTPPEEDAKEAQAAGEALRALSIIGGVSCLAAIRQVLTSSAWDNDDNQWECAEILAEITKEPFMEADDPVAAAKAWLEANPQVEA